MSEYENDTVKYSVNTKPSKTKLKGVIMSNISKIKFPNKYADFFIPIVKIVFLYFVSLS